MRYEELLENITKTTQTIEEIARASKEQEAGITQINDAVTGLDRQTQQNATIAAETREIALETDTIAKEIVADAMKKEFVGKNDIKPKVVKKDIVKEVVKTTPKTINPKPFEHKHEKIEAKIISSNKSSSSDDEWESF